MKKIRLFIEQTMMRYLRKRGWVVFYLEEEHRWCNDMCWLKLYESELARELADE